MFSPSKTGFFPCFPIGWVTWSEMSGLLGLGLHRRSAAAWRKLGWGSSNGDLMGFIIFYNNHDFWILIMDGMTINHIEMAMDQYL